MSPNIALLEVRVFVKDDGGSVMALIEQRGLQMEMVVEKEGEEKAKKGAAPAPVQTTDESTSSSSITVDPTTLDEKEESQLKEAIQKAMLDEKGQDKGYFTVEGLTSVLTTLPQSEWTESKVDRIIQEWYDKGRLMEQQGIGKYTPVQLSYFSSMCRVIFKMTRCNYSAWSDEAEIQTNPKVKLMAGEQM